MFKTLDEFRFWCQKVIPTVFDDSLSYYEVLCKISEIINVLIENNNNIPEYIQEQIKIYITSGEFEEMLKKIMAVYVAEESKIVFGGYSAPIETCGHIYTPENKTITIVGR